MLHSSVSFEDQGPFAIPYFMETGLQVGGAGICIQRAGRKHPSSYLITCPRVLACLNTACNVAFPSIALTVQHSHADLYGSLPPRLHSKY